MKVLRAIIAMGRVCLWLVRKTLGVGTSVSRRSLPSPFQSVAEQALRPAKKPKRRRSDCPPLLGRLERLKRNKYRIAFGLVAAGGLGLATTFAGMMVYYTVIFPNPLAIRKTENAPVIRILARDGSVLAYRGTAHEYMPLDLLPKVIPAALVATEDRRFFDHYGIDPVGVIRAMFANLRAGRFAQGGSTLTQQLAKNLFLTPDRTLTRKIAELGLALWLEIRLSKPEILELYLNQVYFGGGAYGIEAASQRYFGKPARELTLPEAALIAGLLKAPSRYSPANSPDAARARGRVVLDKMVDAGFITQKDEDRALAQPLVFSDAKDPKPAADAGYVVDYVLDQLPSMIGEGHAEAYRRDDARPECAAPGSNRSSLIAWQKKVRRSGQAREPLSCLTATAASARSLAESDYSESQFDRAVKAHRQPGSAFKPFVYLAALEARDDAGQRRGRSADHDRWLVAEERQQQVCRRGHAQAGAGAVDHAERALRADEQPGQVVAGDALDGPPSGAQHPPVGEHDLQAEHVVGGDAVLHAAQAAGVGGEVAADRAPVVAGGVRRIEQPGAGDGVPQRLVHHARLDDGEPVGRRTSRTASIRVRTSVMRAVDGVARTGQAGAGAARDDRDAVPRWRPACTAATSAVLRGRTRRPACPAGASIAWSRA